VEKKEKITFWTLTLRLPGETTKEWVAYVVVGSTSARECNKIIESFVNDETALDVYVDGVLYGASYFTAVARSMVGTPVVDEDKVVRSEN
jgi:hypothetical protein